MRRVRAALMAALLCAALGTGGCLYQGYHRVDFLMPSRAASETYDESELHAHAWLGFADSTGPIDVTEICEDGFVGASHYLTPAQKSLSNPVALVLSPFVRESTVVLRCLEEE
jgi:hypothetical protein